MYLLLTVLSNLIQFIIPNSHKTSVTIATNYYFRSVGSNRQLNTEKHGNIVMNYVS